MTVISNVQRGQMFRQEHDCARGYKKKSAKHKLIFKAQSSIGLVWNGRSDMRERERESK